MNQRPPQPRRRRKLVIAAGLLVAFTVFGFLVAPSIVKSQLEQRASKALGRTVTVGKVRVNPFAASLTLENLDVRLKEGEGSFMGWSRLYVNFDPMTSVFGAWTFGEVEVDGFHVTAVLKRDGTFNFADILALLKEPAGAPNQSAPAIRIDRLTVQHAQLDFQDQSRPQPFATTLGPTGFTLKEFHTTADQQAPYYFEAVTEAGEKLVWSGSVSVAPLASTGELRLENLSLPKYAPYYAHQVLGDLISGQVSVSGRYEAKLDGSTRVMKLADGALQIRDLKMMERGGQQPLVDLPALDVTGVEADAVAMKATVANVALNGGSLYVRREADGSINLLNALRPAGTTAAPVPESTPGATAKTALVPEFVVGEMSLKDFQVEVTDLAAPRPAKLGLTNVQFSLKNVSLSEDAEMPLQLALGWAPAGSVTVTGTVAIKPELNATLQAEVVSLALLPLSPYLEQFINARLTQGAVSTQGAVQVLSSEGMPAVIFEGDVALENLGLVDGTNREELAGFVALTLTGLTVVAEPELTVSLSEVKLDRPYARVVVNQGGSLNLAAVMKKTAPTAAATNPGENLPSDSSAASSESGSEPAPGPTPGIAAAADGSSASPASWPTINIGKVVIADGDFSLTDRSLQPNVRTAITRSGGIIAGLSSASDARASADLQATVDGIGPVAITGELAPLGVKKYVDLQVDFKNVDLQPFSPYSGKYAGYELARGQLNLEVKAKLDDRMLDATNVITLNQFSFGAPVESPVATKLPVRLGVALLKDMNGQIVIDVPMAGNIDDPNLRIGKVVWRVIGNLLTKAAASPFALLGSMFGGGGDELAFQEFAPGSSELLPVETAKLATMTKALINRPGLSLAIEGGTDGPADTHALKQRKLAALVRSRIWEERRETDPNIPPPEQLEIQPEAHAVMVKVVFAEKFPDGSAAVIPVPTAPAVVEAPVTARKSLFRRVVDALTPAAAPGEPATPTEKVEEAAEFATTGPSLDEMTARLADAMEVTDNDLRALADARAQRVRDYFLNEGKIAADRLFLAQGNASAKENRGPRVFLSVQ